MRIRFLLAALIISLTSLLFSCRPNSTTAHRLLIYTPHGQDLLRDFVTRYKQKYPEAEVQFLDMVRARFSNASESRETDRKPISGGVRHTLLFKPRQKKICLPSSTRVGLTKFLPLRTTLRDVGMEHTKHHRSSLTTATPCLHRKRHMIGMMSWIQNGGTRF
jgi:hypothetical protein